MKGKELRLIAAILVGVVAGAAPMTYVLRVTNPSIALPPPRVTLGDATLATFYGPYEVDIDVLASEPPKLVRDFAATLSGLGGDLVKIAPLDGQPQFQFRFDDRDFGGRLTAGDRFVSRFLTEGHYELALAWRGQLISTAKWDITPPSVTFYDPDVRETGTTVQVASASPATPLSQFRASLFSGSGFVASLDPLTAYPYGALGFYDYDNNGYLSPGDAFLSSQVNPGTYELRLDWLGAEILRTSWTVVPPNVTMDFARVGSQTFWLNVTYAQPPTRVGSFGAFVYLSGSLLDYLYSLYNGSSPGGHITFQDRDGDGLLSVGDRFVVVAAFPGNWEFDVVWFGSTVAFKTWTV
ncbi:MAG TPA: hypothetical protein VEM95_01615 [Thermoplasmata archaeon]|nr:hypothetical protein [Thermoplasmata archaeon]